MTTSLAKGSSRKSRLQSGAGGMVAGTGTGALVLQFAHAHPNWSPLIQFLAPALSILTSAVVMWLRTEFDTFVRRKSNQRSLKALRQRVEEIKIFIESCPYPNVKKQAEQLLQKLNQEMLQLIVE